MNSGFVMWVSETRALLLIFKRVSRSDGVRLGLPLNADVPQRTQSEVGGELLTMKNNRLVLYVVSL